MLLIALPLTLASCVLNLSLEYWIAGLGLGVGSAACCFVRQSLLANPRNSAQQIIAFLFMVIGSYAIIDTIYAMT